jgi:hypothetical protein
MRYVVVVYSVLFTIVVASGCAAPQWATHAPTNPPSDPAPATPEQIESAMAEVRQLDVVDPTEHDKLIADLRESAPALWPLVLEQARATAAYRRRWRDRNGAMPQAQRLPPTRDKAPPNACRGESVVAVSFAEQCGCSVGPGTITIPSAGNEENSLGVCNLAFCTEVRSFGAVRKIDKCEFDPGQEVLLYAEVENFASTPTSKGHHTSLKSSYQILDADGRQVAGNGFAVADDYCANPRHDFFLAYHLHLPSQLQLGKHVLAISIEDLQSHRTGQATVEFDVKAAKSGR